MGLIIETQLRPGVREIVAEQWVLAADLGQSADPTAIAVLQHKRMSHLTSKGQETRAGQTFDIRHLQRLPLGLSYVEQVAIVAQLLTRSPLRANCQFVIDATGVGRAVADLFDGAGLMPEQVTITAGTEQTCAGTRRWHVPKGLLISALDARLHTGELRFAAGLQEAEAMRDELKDFRRKISSAGRFSYNAREGQHDDLVLATALALWAVVTKPKPPVAAWGTFNFVC